MTEELQISEAEVMEYVNRDKTVYAVDRTNNYSLHIRNEADLAQAQIALLSYPELTFIVLGAEIAETQ